MTEFEWGNFLGIIILVLIILIIFLIITQVFKLPQAPGNILNPVMRRSPLGSLLCAFGTAVA